MCTASWFYLHIVKFSEHPLSNIDTKRKEKKTKEKKLFFPNDGSS